MKNKVFNFLYSAQDERKAIFYMIAGGFCFATMGALTFKLGKDVDWVFIAFWRMLFSFVLVFFLASKSGKTTILFSRKLLWLRSITGTIAMLATFYSFTHLPVSDVSAITETRPVWVALLAVAILGERLRRALLPITVLSIIGVLLIEKPHFDNRNFAVFVTLAASVLGAVVMICLRKLRDLDPRTIVTHFSLTATVGSVIFMYFFRDIGLYADYFKGYIILTLIGIGIFGTIGQLTMTKAFALGRASIVSSTGYAKVGFSAIYDLILFSAVFELYTIVGMLMILGASTWLLNSSDGLQITRARLNNQDS
ncbi:MAG: DMT family transporter [Candidatus Dadabacteria bacterium]|nr:DMT family transporter [Candidatus Dadabacteria bacterium]NIS07646.1 DMT family transporter [Candidatus Dadabacteria bacterium]NIV42117.1 EamA family transporter [Candidatus Dadabacteria bacterium]NIX14741.1 EamA family transporter [Candidatus Dadabacteria bacterium]NIY21284.1 EamA family transporter [Candidatus Dadabacteria bacterium]